MAGKLASKTVADLFIDTLEAAGVRRIYGVAGDSLNAITDVLRARKTIQWMHVRHEESAAFAAGAEAHVTGELAVCAGSCVPGNLHLINGLYDCHRSRVPVLAIAAQIPSNEIGGGYFQETHPDYLFAQCSHFSELISQARQMPRVLEIAIQTAISKRGVAVVAIPGDIAMLPAPETESFRRFQASNTSVCPAPTDLARLADVLNNAGKITILGGAGCVDAHAELVATAGLLQAPIVHALRGKEFIEYDNPYDVGMTGLLGFSSGYQAMKDCDLLLMLGTDFPYRQFYPSEATIVQIDLRGDQLARRTHVDHGFVGDIKTTLRALMPLLKQKKNDRHLRTALKNYQSSRKELDEKATAHLNGHSTGNGKPKSKANGKAAEEVECNMIHPQYLTRIVNDLAADDTIFTVDVGTPTVWAARYLKMNGKRRLVGSFTHASMAGALPQAIGAQSAFRTRQVVALCGDGGIAMLMGDLLTLRQLALPVKLIVYRNNTLGFVQQEQQAAGLLDWAVGLDNPDFAAMAQAAGLLGIRAESAEDVRPAIERAFAHQGPALVEVFIERQELSLPPTITLKEAAGFNLFLAKAVLSGRGDEVVDLAKTNLLSRVFG